MRMQVFMQIFITLTINYIRVLVQFLSRFGIKGLGLDLKDEDGIKNIKYWKFLAALRALMSSDPLKADFILILICILHRFNTNIFMNSDICLTGS